MLIKKIVLATILTAACSAATVAQVRVGLKGSVQLSNLVESPAAAQKPENLLGFQAGLMLDAPITEQLSIRPQLLYSIKGAKQSFNAQGFSGETKASINYLEVPVQLTYGFEAGAGYVVLGAGPYVGYGLSGNATVTVNGQTESESFTFDDNDGLKRIDYGLHVSVGYELSSGLMVSGYFTPGLANITQTTAGSNESIKTTAFGLSVGYFFGSNR